VGEPRRRGRTKVIVRGWMLVLAATLTALLTSTSGVAAIAESERNSVSWLVQAGKSFQRAGEYTVRLRNTEFEDAISAYGRPSSCRVVGSANHAVATWADRGIWIDLWTLGALPEGETGCLSPDLIHVSEIRLTGPRWTTALGLHVGDRTTKLRKLYPKAIYRDRRVNGRRSEYWLVSVHGPCRIGRCSQFEQRYGIDSPRLTAQVRNGRVVAFWIPVGGQGE